MTSRERVRAVLNHQMPDRVPNGMGACETAGLHVMAYDKLQNALGVERKPPRINTFMTNAVFEEPVIRAMDGDILQLASLKLCKSPLRGDVANRWKEQKLWGKTFSIPVEDRFREEPDGSVIWETYNNKVCPKGHYYFSNRETSDLMADIEVPDPEDFCPPDSFPDETLRELENTAKQMYEQTDLSLCIGESITDLQVQPAGMVGTMILMMEEPEIMHAFLEKCEEAAFKQITLLDQAVGKYVDMLSIAHDFGDNRGVTIGADLWREIYKPHYKNLFQGWQKRTNMKINMHSCGSISEILPDLIECGLQVLNPVQTSAANMSVESLKEKFGKDVIFFGGAYDAQLVDLQATYEEVYNTVYRNIKVLAQGGNYIFTAVHNLPANIPEHHLKAMIDAYKDARAYE